ncbi:uncharacterized protein C7orf50 homolog [Anneissia japonica]|uniref:uncharacterized protein C7orf50 homolog n=1 Tax=Anneissia japonica TaxID=1529436 RepID=UPI0014256F7C|nr:uncharacterized protein C7orf50 homolog [Anneissia japonica]XP_033121540.1 uncharacterized protein C7orf50 homolog [Anneissia japonica]
MEDVEKITENTGNISIAKKKKKKIKKSKDLQLQAPIKDTDDPKETMKKETGVKSNDGDKNKKKKERKRKAIEELKDNDKQERTNIQQKSKKKKKKKSTKPIAETAEEEAVESRAKQLAIQYLQQWKHFRNVWSFQKVRQVWLLRNMYDVDMVDDEVFEILIEYLEPLKGMAKTTTLQKAEQLLKDQEQSDSEQEDTHTKEETDVQKRAKLTDKQLDRVRQVMQILV